MGHNSSEYVFSLFIHQDLKPPVHSLNTIVLHSVLLRPHRHCMVSYVMWVTVVLSNTLAPKDGYGYLSWVIYEAAKY